MGAVRALLVAIVVLGGCSFRAQSGAPGAAEVDAAAGVVDAPRPFDPVTDCPGAYGTMLPSSTSRYRVITTLATFWPHDATCNDDVPGATHAVVLETMQELVELDAVLDATQTLDRYYVGGIQDPQATVRTAGWISFDGEPLLQTAWYAPEFEPDDGGLDLIEDHGQQLVILDRLLQYLHDAAGVTAYGIVCECDGRRVAEKAKAFVVGDPNNPAPP
jgi:hypothetical protein